MVGSGASRDRSPLLRYGSGRSDSDDIELLALSRHSKVASDRGNLVRLPLRTVFYALNGVALFVLLSLCISMHNTISRLESPTVVTVYVQNQNTMKPVSNQLMIPLHLKCKDPKLCRTDGDFEYFVRNTTDWDDRMTVMCLWEYSEAQHVAREICLPPMLEVYIALTLAPVEEEVKENDTDRCGFYFIPHVALRRWIAQFQDFFVNSFDIQWIRSRTPPTRTRTQISTTRCWSHPRRRRTTVSPWGHFRTLKSSSISSKQSRLPP
ncbi:hypothetical protein PInf_012522 [Phytophthora infestans]|nr:hypothetical protein PInf_012522 [Phytophthora infestans]